LGKIYSCGGAIDYGETPIEAALRETKEESGLSLSPAQLQVLQVRNVGKNKDGYIDYFVMLPTIPYIPGGNPHCIWESQDVPTILGVPTQNRWAFIDVTIVKAAFTYSPCNLNPETSKFSQIYTLLVSRIYNL
jgi:8-oxo-dGTP pyrophosphatase MutT (NUDIX family)